MTFNLTPIQATNLAKALQYFDAHHVVVEVLGNGSVWLMQEGKHWSIEPSGRINVLLDVENKDE